MTFVIGAYYSNWSVYGNRGPKQYPSALSHQLTHVFYAFMVPSAESGIVKHTDEWADSQLPIGNEKGAISSLMLLKKSRPLLKVLVSIGGWGTDQQFTAVVQNDNKMKNFVTSSIDILKTFSFDGIDIDWEYPANPEQALKLLELLRLLRSGLNNINPNLLLTIASPAAKEHLKILDIRQIDSLVNFWNVMCFDFAGNDWSTRSGYHSNLYGNNGCNDLNAALVLHQYLISGASREKIVLGMPAYGRVFYSPQGRHVGTQFKKKVKVEGSEPDIIDFNQIDRTNETVDDSCVAAWTYDTNKNALVTYDNENTVAIKASYVREHGLAGGFWWDAKGDTADHLLVLSFANQIE